MFNRIAVLLLVAVSFASAKTYTFGVSSTAQVGTAELKPGDYKLKVEGTQAVLMDRTGRQIEATAQVESRDRKYSQTAVTSSTESGITRIRSIELGGSNYKVVFQ